MKKLIAVFLTLLVCFTLTACNFDILKHTNLQSDFPSPTPTPEVMEPDYSNVTYYSYKNSRYGYTIDVPSFLISPEEPTNGDGNKFISSDGKISLIVWGSKTPMVSEETSTLDGLYEYSLSNLDYEPTYQTKGNNYFVFSGILDDNIIYEKHILKTDLTENVFVICYPQKLKNEYDSIVTHLFNSMTPGVGIDSEVTE